MTTPIAQLDYAPDSTRRRRRARRGVLLVLLTIALVSSIKWFKPALNHAQLLYYQHRCLKHTAAPDQIVLDNSLFLNPDGGDWNRFYTRFSPPGGRIYAPVFLHELRRKDGNSYLVTVEVANVYPQSLGFETNVVAPGTPWTRPQLRSNRNWAIPLKNSGISKGSLRLYAGQIDPSDSSHLTIPFQVGDHHGIIDGWLQNDDTILFELRTPLPTNN